MSFLLKPKIFEFFGNYAKLADTLKDGNDKGIWERYQESLGEGYDTEIQPLLDIFLNNTIVPETMLSKLIPTMERVLGEPIRILDVPGNLALIELLRRKIIRFAQKIYNIKSTELSYQVLLNLLGLEGVTIDSFVVSGGFDSSLTLDDESRVFDILDSCTQCREYSIITSGSITLSTEIISGINRIITFLEPINATLREFTYNGVKVELNNIIVFVSNGQLFIDNENDPGITLTLIDGILYKDGINADLYTFNDQDGQLYLTTP